MDDYLRDSPSGNGPKMNHKDNRRNVNYSSHPQEFNMILASNVDHVFDFNARDTSKELNMPPASDPFYETFDFLGSPYNQNNVSPANPIDPVGSLEFNRSETASVEPFAYSVSQQDPLNGLDSIISPQNDIESNMFSTSQYFSPNARGNQFSLLNPIAENTFSGLYQENTFSPDLNQPGGITIPKNLNLNLYLSPNAFVSPQFNAYEGSYDTVTSPFSSSYLNSPPPINLTQSTSIPNHSSYALASLSRALSPIPNQELGVSAPTGQSIAQQRAVGENSVGTEMTQEEKAKRRREFHNAVERRRRDLIKEKIKILGVLVPPSLLNPQLSAVEALLKLQKPLSKELREIIESTKVKEIKPNKAAILLSAVEYIQHLHYVLDKQKARREEIEGILASLENGPGSYSYQPMDNYPDSSVSLHNQPVEDFNPDVFFSDVLADVNK